MNVYGLSEGEAQALLAEADLALESAAGQEVTVSGVTGSTEDTTDPFGTETGGTRADVTVDDGTGEQVNPRAIQDFIRPMDRRTQEFEAILAGDCIFWFQRDLDLADVDDITITDAQGGLWTPVIQPGVALLNYLESALEGTSCFMGVHCRRKP